MYTSTTPSIAASKSADHSVLNPAVTKIESPSSPIAEMMPMTERLLKTSCSPPFSDQSACMKKMNMSSSRPQSCSRSAPGPATSCGSPMSSLRFCRSFSLHMRRRSPPASVKLRHMKSTSVACPYMKGCTLTNDRSR